MTKIRSGLTRYQKERSKLIRSGVTGGTVPPRMTLSTLLNKYYSKREMNKALKEMSLFTARKATQTIEIGGETYSQYEIERFRLRLGRERKATTRELKAMKSYTAANPLQHDMYVKKLEARAKELSKTWQSLLGTRAGAEVDTRSVKSENLYNNWINALFQDSNILGFDQNKVEEIIKKLNKLTPVQFERLFNEDPAITYIFDYYNTEVRGTTKGEISKKLAAEAFEALYQRLDQTIERYKNI